MLQSQLEKVCSLLSRNRLKGKKTTNQQQQQSIEAEHSDKVEAQN